jgi:hypothetical protein
MSENAVLEWASSYFSEGCYAREKNETELGYVFGIRRFVDQENKFFVEIDYTQFGGGSERGIEYIDINDLYCLYRERSGVLVYELKPSTGSL